VPVKILVTGVTGFVGQTVVPALLGAGFHVRGTSRTRPKSGWAKHSDFEFEVCDLASGDLGPLLEGVDAVVHLAARAHIMHENSPDPAEANRLANVVATLRLAEASAKHGVKQFIFISTIKVNGESTTRTPFTEVDKSSPQDAYARSKAEAEAGLRLIARSSDMGCTIFRPPLIYGPGMKGNLANLVRAIKKGIPLPLGAIRNERSLLYVGNLSDAIRAALEKPSTETRLFLVSDGEDISTTELIRTIGNSLGVRPILLGVPPGLLSLAFRLIGRASAGNRLLGSLVVDSSRIHSELGWQPPYTLEQGFKLSFSVLSEQ
jgi:nucleoside-diphosphate-sugar epimerase